MALAAAKHLACAYELHIAVRQGPLVKQFAQYGRLVRASPTMPFGYGTRVRWLLQAARSLLDGVRIAAYVRRHRIAAVYTNSGVLLGPVIGARLASVPAVVHARELPPDQLSRGLFATLGALADTVVAVSTPVQDEFAQARRARVVKIHDGIPIPPPAPAPNHAFRACPQLCLIGSVEGDGRKGQDIAIDAVACLAAKGVPARLKLVGPIHNQTVARDLEHRARALGVEVQLTGPIDRVDDIIADSDVVLSCARQEPLGLTLMEALARETPVVATRVGGVPDIIRDGETGVLVPPGHPEGVADGILRMLTAPEEARAMAGQGRADMAARFDQANGLNWLERELARYVPSF